MFLLAYRYVQYMYVVPIESRKGGKKGLGMKLPLLVNCYVGARN